MNLRKKKELAAKTLNVGKERIIFVESRLDEIKEAITKQDIRDLVERKAILLKEKQGRKKVKKRKNARGAGKIKKKINVRKRNYVKVTRKLRKYLKAVKEKLGMGREEVKEIRKAIRNKKFKSKANLKEHLGERK